MVFKRKQDSKADKKRRMRTEQSQEEGIYRKTEREER